MSEERRICVASLSDYNAGILHGRWIDANQDADDIHEEVQAMLRASKEPNVMVDCPHLVNGSCNQNPDYTGPYVCDTCKESGKVPSAEEWAIHDYEGFGGIKLSEWESFETVSKLAECLEEYGEAFGAWYGSQGEESERDEWLEQFQEAYIGTFDSLTEWAEEYAEETGMFSNVPENLKYYFDFEAWGRDAELGGDIWTARTSEGLAIFWNH